MLAVKGIYDNGRITLQEKVKTTKPVNVIITFLDETPKKEKKIELSKFSFKKSKTILKEYDGNLSEAVIEERRKEL